MYRVSTSQMTANGLYAIQKNQSVINSLMQEVATGKKQDMPLVDKVQAHDYMVDISNITQYLINNQRIEPQIKEQETALSSINEKMIQMKELAIEIQNPATFDKNTFQTKFDSLKEEMLGLLNSKDTLGNYVFSGSLGDTKPFNDFNSYAGDNNIRKINISKGVSADVNVPGNSIITTNFNNFLNKIQQGLNTQNFDTTALDDINKSVDDVSLSISKIGFTMNKMDDFKNYLNDIQVDKEAYLSTLTDADMAESISKLNQAQTAYQAALKSYSIIQNLSLFDYI